MPSLVQIRIDGTDFGAMADKLENKIPGLIAATMQTNRGLLFRNSGQWNGHRRWRALRCRDGQPLLDRGTLAQSIGPRNDGVRPGQGVESIVRMSGGLSGEITIGTSLAYAAVHNFGAIIRPKTKKALAFQCGKSWIVVKKVVIPQRRFDNINETDKREVQETVANYIANVLGSA